MPPHGPGQIGGSHSHDPDYPEDNFNLYTQLDTTTSALNVTKPEDCLGVFKPHALRMNPLPHLISDADEEIIIIARFVSPISLRKLIVMGHGSDTSCHPRTLRLYPNQEEIDFTSVNSYSPAQEFTLPINMDGSVELTTVLQPFTLINSLVFYFGSNYGSEFTSIQYIGMQGEHTHYRREAVDTTYEVLCTGKEDVENPADNQAADKAGF